MNLFKKVLFAGTAICAASALAQSCGCLLYTSPSPEISRRKPLDEIRHCAGRKPHVLT